MAAASFEFAPFRLDPERRALTRGGSEITLSRKAFDTLLVLLEEQGNVVAKDVLMKRVWPDSFVEENSLNQSISALRKALGDQAGVPKYIETVSGRGYRFVAPIVVHAAPPRTAESTPRTLAVLPLRSPGADEGDWLGIGIADTLITRLSNVRELVVRPTSAVLRFAASHDPVETGRALDVDAVLEGNVRKSGDRLRVNVQLVSVASGAPIWARTFDERFTEIFAVEDAISERVAEALTSRLSGEERSRLTHRATENSEAYRLYLNGRWYADRLTRESLTKALESLQQAVDLDPLYALGHAGLAYHYLQSADLMMPSREAMTHAEEAARRALAIDESLVDARSALATVFLFRDWNRAASEREFERAIAIDPRNVHARQMYGWCLTLSGAFDHAMLQFRTAEEIDPFSTANGLYAVPSLYYARRYDEALVRTRAMIERDPAFWLAHVILGRTLEATSDLAGAIACYEEARRVDDSFDESLGDLGRALGKSGRTAEAKAVLARLTGAPAFTIANVHLGLGDLEQTFARLNDAIDERSWYVTWYRIDPMLDPLRDDPRFARLLERVSPTPSTPGQAARDRLGAVRLS